MAPVLLLKTFVLSHFLYFFFYDEILRNQILLFHPIEELFIPRFVSTLHTFGRDPKWNPHIHVLITEGASGHSIVWRPFKHIPYSMLRKRFQDTLIDLLCQKLDKDSFYPLECYLFKTYKDGFYVYAKPNPSTDSKKVVDYVVRYTGRPAMAQSRITHYDGQQVTFWYQRHEDHQKVTETLHAIDFIKRLIIHIPDQQFKTVRYYGLYAKNIYTTQNSLRCYLPLSLKLSKCLKTGVIAFYFLLDVTLLNVPVDTLLNSSTSFILRKKAWIIRLIHLIILLRIIKLGGLYG